ncbi:MAG: hypothetical protein R3B93_15365 [Bacteroidia bacterium]
MSRFIPIFIFDSCSELKPPAVEFPSKAHQAVKVSPFEATRGSKGVTGPFLSPESSMNNKP